MAVSAPLEFDGSAVGVMRLVTATRELDKQVVLLALAIMGFAVVISCVVLLVNLAFMRLFRESKGHTAYSIIESDGRLPEGITEELKTNPYIHDVMIVQS